MWKTLHFAWFNTLHNFHFSSLFFLRLSLLPLVPLFAFPVASWLHLSLNCTGAEKTSYFVPLWFTYQLIALVELNLSFWQNHKEAAFGSRKTPKPQSWIIAAEQRVHFLDFSCDIFRGLLHLSSRLKIQIRKHNNCTKPKTEWSKLIDFHTNARWHMVNINQIIWQIWKYIIR